MDSHRHMDRLPAIAFLLWSMGWLYLTFKISPTSIGNVPGPRFFPLVLGVSMLILSSWLLLKTFMKDSKHRKAMTCDQEDQEVIWEGTIFDVRGTVTLVLMFLYIWAMGKIGFVYATLIGMPIFLYYSFQVRNVLIILAFALTLSFGLDFIFQDLLGMTLPRFRLF